jgi:hypothetical protein
LTSFLQDDGGVKTANNDSSPGAPPRAPTLTVYFVAASPVRSSEVAHDRRQPGAQACERVNAAACPQRDSGAGLSRESALRRFHVRRASGELVDGMRGFAALWQRRAQ